MNDVWLWFFLVLALVLAVEIALLFVGLQILFAMRMAIMGAMGELAKGTNRKQP